MIPFRSSTAGNLRYQQLVLGYLSMEKILATEVLDNVYYCRQPNTGFIRDQLHMFGPYSKGHLFPIRHPVGLDWQNELTPPFRYTRQTVFASALDRQLQEIHLG